MAIQVKHPNAKCPKCGGPNYYKSADGFRPFCSSKCADAGTSPRRKRYAREDMLAAMITHALNWAGGEEEEEEEVE